MNEDDLLNLLVNSSMNTGQYAASIPNGSGWTNYNYIPDYPVQDATKLMLMQSQINNAGSGTGGMDSMGLGRSGGGGGGRIAPGSLVGLYNSTANQQDAAAQRALELQIAQMQNGTTQTRNANDYALGQGNLSLGQNRLALDTMLGQRSQQLQAGEQFANRATRQLAAPGGRLNPTLAPIMGISSIAGPTPY